MDRTFWCLHDHVPTFGVLILPTLIGAILLTTFTVIVLRTWDFDPLIAYGLWAIIVPVGVLTILTFLPLPCAVFAWFQAIREPKTAGECFGWCAYRAGRLLKVFAWLLFSYTWWFLLFGIPMLFLWARTCHAPMVALFEDQPRIFHRSRQLMREDGAIHVLAGLFFLITLVVGSLIPLPRLLLLSKLFQGEWTIIVEESLWAFELISGILLFCGIAMSWCVSLALFYHDLRQYREGETIKKKVDLLFDKYMQAGSRVE